VTIDRTLLAVSALAALVAAVCAYRAVTDGRAFHRELERDEARTRLLRIADALADLSSASFTVAGGGAGPSYGLFRAALARFRAAVETTADPIPSCRRLAAYDLDPGRIYDDGQAVTEAAEAAFDELREAIRTR
jgi:hypothetical protein